MTADTLLTVLSLVLNAIVIGIVSWMKSDVSEVHQLKIDVRQVHESVNGNTKRLEDKLEAALKQVSVLETERDAESDTSE